MNVEEKYKKRQKIKAALWLILPLLLLAAFLLPIVGFSVFVWMAITIGVGFYYGRAWCDVCPRGAFFDIAMRRINLGQNVPSFLRSMTFRTGIMIVLIGVMVFWLACMWGHPLGMGKMLAMIMLGTTVIGVALAIPFHVRTWCAFCPMGTLACWLGRGKHSLQIDNRRCISCGACAQVCPMQHFPGAHRERGLLESGDCLKCETCMVHCPQHALTFGAISEDK